jgi:UDP-N-acetylmuramoylalanine--D-glutamate ligase
MVSWLRHRGARVSVADTRQAPPCGAQLQREFPDMSVVRGEFRPESFENVDLIAISPGVPVAEPLVESAARRGVPVVGD